MTNDTYIPNARDATVAYWGRNSSGVYRTHCVTCCDDHPLTDAARIYGDLYIPTGERNRADDAECCDVCSVTLLSLSESCQREHDEQQAMWARVSRVNHLIEYGIPAFVRCRVY